MNKKLINEIDRINQLMLINEQPAAIVNVGKKLASTADDFIKKFIKSDLDNVARQEVDAVATRVRRGALQSLDELADDELRILLKHLDYKKLGTYLFENGLLISRNAIDTNTQRIIDALINSPNPAEKYKEILMNLKSGARQDFFGTVPGMGDELLPMADQFYDEWLNQIKNTLKTQQPDLYNNISKSLVQKSVTALSQKAKLFLDDWAFRNIQTIRRVLTNSYKSQETLSKQFLTLADEMATAVSQGKSSEYYTKKMADILTTMNKSFETDISKLVAQFKNDPKYTKDIALEFERSGAYSSILKALSENKNARQALIEYASAWKNLLWPFKNKESFLDWGSRFTNMILQQSPYTFEETVKKLQTKGLGNVLAGRVASGIFAKWIALPILLGLGKTLVGIPLELLEWANNSFGGEYQNPWGPTGEEGKKDWFEAIANNFKSTFPEGFEMVVPFGTFVDDIWNALIEGNEIKAEDYVDSTREEIEDVENSLSNTTNNLIPQELSTYGEHIKVIDGKLYWDQKPYMIEKIDNVWAVYFPAEGNSPEEWWPIDKVAEGN